MAVDWELVRVTPPQRKGERILLEAGKGAYLVGRSVGCDIRLFSPTASREHARLRLDESGSWLIEPKPDKQVLADGEPIDGSCELCEGLSLVMGSDRMRCRTAGAEQSAEPAVTPAAKPLALMWGAAALGLALLVLIAWRVAGT